MSAYEEAFALSPACPPACCHALVRADRTPKLQPNSEPHRHCNPVRSLTPSLSGGDLEERWVPLLHSDPRAADSDPHQILAPNANPQCDHTSHPLTLTPTLSGDSSGEAFAVYSACRLASCRGLRSEAEEGRGQGWGPLRHIRPRQERGTSDIFSSLTHRPHQPQAEALA